MHLKRAEVRKIIPIQRKSTKYVARASNNSRNGVPVIIAIRDMLNLARNVKEVKLMVAEKLLKLNGRQIVDYKEGIKLFNVLEADKKYILTILKTGRYAFEEIKEDTRIAKIIGKKILRGKKVQINLHDGTNIFSDEKVSVGDTLVLDFKNKVKKVLPLSVGKEVFIISGKSMGNTGKIKEINGKKVIIQMEDREVSLNSSYIIVI